MNWYKSGTVNFPHVTLFECCMYLMYLVNHITVITKIQHCEGNVVVRMIEGHKYKILCRSGVSLVVCRSVCCFTSFCALVCSKIGFKCWRVKIDFCGLCQYLLKLGGIKELM